jgi:hypothetical protein
MRGLNAIVDLHAVKSVVGYKCEAECLDVILLGKTECSVHDSLSPGGRKDPENLGVVRFY